VTEVCAVVTRWDWDTTAMSGDSRTPKARCLHPREEHDQDGVGVWHCGKCEHERGCFHPYGGEDGLDTIKVDG
jgi:hypothetical protein